MFEEWFAFECYSKIQHGVPNSNQNLFHKWIFPVYFNTSTLWFISRHWYQILKKTVRNRNMITGNQCKIWIHVYINYVCMAFTTINKSQAWIVFYLLELNQPHSINNRCTKTPDQTRDQKSILYKLVK